MNDASSTLETWQEIESLVEELTELTKSQTRPREFHAELLDRAVRVLAGDAGAVWLADDSELRLEYQINLGDLVLSADSQSQSQHRRLLEEVLATGTPRIAPPQSGPSDGDEAANPTHLLLLLTPILVDRQAVGVIEVFRQSGASPKTQRGYADVMTVLGELASDFHGQRLLRELRDRDSVWQQFDRFASSVHRDLELTATAYAIANESRPLLDCDRVSVAVLRGRKARVLAASGMDLVDRRSTTVRQLQTLAQHAARQGQTIHFHSGQETTETQVSAEVCQYCREGNVDTLIVVPLRVAADRSSRAAAKVVGVLIVERFRNRPQEISEQRLAAIARHSASALGNAVTLRNLPLMPLVRLLARLKWLISVRRLPIMLVVLLLLGGAVTALVVVPADFSIEGRGELQPVVVHHFYAPAAGEVKRLDLQHRDALNPNVAHVAKDHVAVVLSNRELEFEFARVRGELDTAMAEMETNSNVLTSAPRDRRDDPFYQELRAKQEILRVKIESLTGLKQLLTEQRDALELKSPIDGEVLTWKAEENVLSRPVLQGQKLLTVADTAGQWILEVEVPEHDIGHVLEADEEAESPLSVTFILKSDPNTEYRGTVLKIAPAAEVRPGEEAVVLVTVGIDAGSLPQVRPGTQVVAKVDCGRRPLGYVWLHDLWDAFRAKVLF